MNRDHVKAAYAHTHPAESKQRIAASAGKALRFAHSMKQGSAISARPLDLDALVRHYMEIYNKADAVARGILPLTRIWRPA